MKVLFTCGGTAGHINPALAIAQTVRQNDPAAEFLFVGTERGKESVLVPREGYALSYVNSIGFARPLYSPVNIKAAWVALTSPYSKQTTRILKDFAPDIVIGTGGYACWPIAAAAVRMHIPVALHESNVLPGLAIRRLQGRVDRIWTHFDDTANRLKRRDAVLQVGNPLRDEFGALTREKARAHLGIPAEEFRILSFGGSIGSQPINDAVLDLMKKVSSKHADVVHLHATGVRENQAFMQAFSELGESCGNCLPQEYIYDMPYQMAAADLVIARAGAMTLSELARMNKASILIPSPHVVDNHQYLNAKTLADAGAALLVEEKDIAAGALCQAVEGLLADRSRLTSIEKAVSAFADPDANRRIWEDILQLVNTKKSRY